MDYRIWTDAQWMRDRKIIRVALTNGPTSVTAVGLENRLRIEINRLGASVMAAYWTVKDGTGEMLSEFTSASALEVARKVVPAHYDAFRLHVSSSYRELFERTLKQILEREDWQIMRVKRPVRPRHQESANSASKSREFAARV